MTVGQRGTHVGQKKSPKPRRCKPVGLWDMWDAAHTCIYGNIFSILFPLKKQFLARRETCGICPTVPHIPAIHADTSSFPWDRLSHTFPQSHTKGGTMMANEKDIQTILERSGYKIPPYRMACVAKDAAKIVGLCIACFIRKTSRNSRLERCLYIFRNFSRYGVRFFCFIYQCRFG